MTEMYIIDQVIDEINSEIDLVLMQNDSSHLKRLFADDLEQLLEESVEYKEGRYLMQDLLVNISLKKLNRYFEKQLLSYRVSVANKFLVIDQITFKTNTDRLLELDIRLDHTTIIDEFIIYGKSKLRFPFAATFTIRPYRNSEGYFYTGNPISTGDGILLEVLHHLQEGDQPGFLSDSYVKRINLSLDQIFSMIVQIFFEKIFGMILVQIQMHFNRDHHSF